MKLQQCIIPSLPLKCVLFLRGHYGGDGFIYGGNGEIGDALRGGQADVSFGRWTGFDVNFKKMMNEFKAEFGEKYLAFRHI